MGFATSHRRARISRGVACLALCLSWIAITSPATQGATWTILASRGEESEKNAVDLLSVELSGIPGIELVERADVQSLLREQQLSAFGEEMDSLAVGRLLGVDGFALWESQTGQPDREAARLICFDGRTGVRLLDQVLTGHRLEDLIDEAKDAIREAKRKRDAVDRRDIVLMSISSVRDAAPEQLNERIPEAIQEIERTLISQPGIVLLERERLRFVLQEKMLPIAEAQAHLLAAAQSVTVEFSRRSGGQLAVVLRIHHPLDEPAITVDWDLEPAHRSGFVERLRQSLAERDARLMTRPRDDQSQRAHEVALLEKDGLRWDQFGAPMATAVRWEAAYLLSPHRSRLTRLEGALRGALRLAFLDPGTYSTLVPDRRRGRDGRRELRPEAVRPAPEEMWLRALEIADYRLSVQERLDGVPPDLEPMMLSDFLFNFAYLRPDHHPRAISLAQTFLDREEVFVTKRVATFRPDPNRATTELERRASAASIRFQLYCSAGRYLRSDWVPELLDRIREVDPRDERVPEDAFTREALVDLSPAQREEFFRVAGTAFSPPRGELSLGYRYAELWLDAWHGGKDRQRTLQQRVEQYLTDVTESLVSPPEKPPHKRAGLWDPFRSVIIPADQAYGLQWTKEALALPGLARRSELTVATVRRLLDHGIVHAELVKQFNPKVPVERQLMEKAITVLAGEQSRYSAESRANLTAGLRDRLGETTPVVNLESRMKPVFPVSGGDTVRYEVIHACRSPIGIVIFTRRYDDKQSVWLTEAHVHDGTSTRILGTYAFPAEAVSAAEANLKRLTIIGDPRPQNFFDMAVSTAVPQVNDEFLLLPTAMGGIVAYPRSGGPAFVLDESTGLPSSFVQALALHGNTLYAWLGPQGLSASLVAIDLASRQIRVLVSTTQEALTTPLSNFPTGQCLGMVISSDGASLDMLMWGFGSDTRSGLWRMETQSGELQSVTTGEFSSNWMVQIGETLTFAKHGIRYGKDRRSGGPRFSDIAAIDSRTLQVEEMPRPKQVMEVYLPLPRDSDRRVWVSPRLEQVIEERRETGEFARFDLITRRRGERMKWCEISRDGDEMLWYSNQRVWAVRWSTLVP